MYPVVERLNGPGVFIGLIIILNLKLIFEERLLVDQFLGYKDYQKKSWRLIPFIY